MGSLDKEIKKKSDVEVTRLGRDLDRRLKQLDEKRDREVKKVVEETRGGPADAGAARVKEIEKDHHARKHELERAYEMKAKEIGKSSALTHEGLKMLQAEAEERLDHIDSRIAGLEAKRREATARRSAVEFLRDNRDRQLVNDVYGADQVERLTEQIEHTGRLIAELREKREKQEMLCRLLKK